MSGWVGAASPLASWQPTSGPGLLGGGAAATYGYPMASGLLAAMSSPQSVPTDWTQQAMSLAGNPHAGPYAASDGALPAGFGTTGTSPAYPTAGSTTGGSSGQQIAGGLLGALAKNPSILKNGVSAIQGLLSPSMDSALGLTTANSTPAVLGASGLAPMGTGAVTSVGNAAGASAANELAAAGLGGGAGAIANPAIAQAIADYAPGAASALAAPALQSIGTGAADAVANQAETSAAQELASAGYGSGASAAGSGGATASSGLGTASQALGALGAGYSAYNTIKNWQSGNTGSDALNGAETGASVGTMIAPGIGTAIGGLIGGAAGALSSAFGGGEKDPETQNWNSLAGTYDQNPSVMSSANPSQLYQGLAGVMDAKNNSPGHSEPIEQVFGRMGEQNLMDQMANYVNQQYQAGKIKPGESIGQQWSQSVYPWLTSKGATINPNQRTSSGAPEGSALIGDLQGLLGDWETGGISPTSQLGVNGQTIGGLINFAGLSPQQLAAMQKPSTPSIVRRGPATRALAFGMR